MWIIYLMQIQNNEFLINAKFAVFGIILILQEYAPWDERSGCAPAYPRAHTSTPFSLTCANVFEQFYHWPAGRACNHLVPENWCACAGVGIVLAGTH